MTRYEQEESGLIPQRMIPSKKGDWVKVSEIEELLDIVEDGDLLYKLEDALEGNGDIGDSETLENLKDLVTKLKEL